MHLVVDSSGVRMDCGSIFLILFYKGIFRAQDPTPSMAMVPASQDPNKLKVNDKGLCVSAPVNGSENFGELTNKAFIKLGDHVKALKQQVISCALVSNVQLSQATAKNKSLENELRKERAILESQTKNLQDAKRAIDNLSSELSRCKAE